MVHIHLHESFHKLVEERDAEICCFNSMCSSICAFDICSICWMHRILRYLTPKSKKRSIVGIKGCTKRRKTPGLCFKGEAYESNLTDSHRIATANQIVLVFIAGLVYPTKVILLYCSLLKSRKKTLKIRSLFEKQISVIIVKFKNILMQ